MKRVIIILFSVLFFGVPLVFFPKTSELFEFNKIVFLYAVTILVSTLWIIECIFERKFIFKRTLLDIPLILFLISELLSTIFSIDPRTSIFGYYSRFNGGLLSITSYALLYWAFVTHISRKEIPRIFLNIMIASSISAVWGVLEHYGKSPSCALITGSFDASCWVQDVQLRVFATFGQPNWMAAWMAAIIPLTWGVFLFASKKPSQKLQIGSAILSVVFTSALLFTKSKSGIAAFGVSFVIFVAFILFFRFKAFKKTLSKQMFILPLFLAIAIAVFGSPWTPTIFELQQKQTEVVKTPQTQGGTALETGGTDSGIIRSIVWRGAFSVWREFPLLGSGVETFAFSYYRGRPMEHNLVSEWNFLYNKAHNEYLNYLATTGMFGILTYLITIGASVLLMIQTVRTQQKSDDFYITTALLSGYLSLTFTNFFGFSVVPTSVLFYLLPAVAFSLKVTSSEEKSVPKPSSMQIIGVSFVSILALYIGLMLFNYWQADYLYAQAQQAQNNEDYTQSLHDFNNAISLSPYEPTYHAQLGALYADLTTAKEADAALIETFTTKSIREFDIAQKLSPQNIRILKLSANSYATLGEIDPKYLLTTLDITNNLQTLAPTDPSVLYQQCLTLAKMGRFEEAIQAGETAVAMKTDYKIARRLLAYLYEQTKQTEKAKSQLKHILKNISPDDTAVQKELQSLEGK